MRVAAVLLFSLSLTTIPAYAVTPSMNFDLAQTDTVSLDTPFTVQSKTQLPGKVLSPGSYVLTIKDHLSDRAILQVKGKDGKVVCTFLGVFEPGNTTQANGPLILPTDSGGVALRGFTFTGGRTIEFVYPKAEAAAVANRTSAAVLAIDPPSDNLKANADNTLSKEDAQIVTLWSLQATRVSPTEKGISAKKWVPQTQEAAAPAIAAATPGTSSSKPAGKRVAPAEKQVATNRVPTIKALPHTASNMPLLLLMSLLSLTGAGSLAARRTLLAKR